MLYNKNNLYSIKTKFVMKTLFTLALLAVTTIASAQPRHGNHHGKGHYKNHKKHQKHYNHNRNDYKHNKKVVKNNNQLNNNYNLSLKIIRNNFLRLSQAQRSKLQVSLNFLIANNYGPRDYEYRLCKDLRSILTRNQYAMWERR